MRRRINMRGLGDGFVATSNYWQQLASQRIQYVMVPGIPSMRLVSAQRPPRAVLRGLGDPTNPYDPDFDYGSLSFGNTPNAVIPSGTSTPPPQPQQPNAWQQFTDWMGSPVSPGSSFKNGHLVSGAALLAAIAGMGRKGRR